MIMPPSPTDLHSAAHRLDPEGTQAQKLETVGRLASGIVHDLNNLLTAIRGYSEFVLTGLSVGDPLRQDAEEIRKASERACALTGQLLDYCRQRPPRLEPVDLNEVVKAIDKLLRRLIGEDIDVITVLEPRITPVLADRTQLEQVIVNLAVNARDAMPRGGRLLIETANVPAGADHGPMRTAVGPCAVLTVADSGTGMDEATRRRMFEPFFTTKGPHNGTGLGLSNVRLIVERLGGRITVTSAVGEGTAVQIYLPTRGRSDARRMPPSLGTATPGQTRTGAVERAGPGSVLRHG